jgi:hypothetical protein
MNTITLSPSGDAMAAYDQLVDGASLTIVGADCPMATDTYTLVNYSESGSNVVLTVQTLATATDELTDITNCVVKLDNACEWVPPVGDDSSCSTTLEPTITVPCILSEEHVGYDDIVYISGRCDGNDDANTNIVCPDNEVLRTNTMGSSVQECCAPHVWFLGGINETCDTTCERQSSSCALPIMRNGTIDEWGDITEEELRVLIDNGDVTDPDGVESTRVVCENTDYDPNTQEPPRSDAYKDYIDVSSSSLSGSDAISSGLHVANENHLPSIRISNGQCLIQSEGVNQSCSALPRFEVLTGESTTSWASDHHKRICKCVNQASQAAALRDSCNCSSTNSICGPDGTNSCVNNVCDFGECTRLDTAVGTAVGTAGGTAVGTAVGTAGGTAVGTAGGTAGWYLGEAGSNQSCVQVCTLHELGCEDGNWGATSPDALRTALSLVDGHTEDCPENIAQTSSDYSPYITDSVCRSSDSTGSVCSTMTPDPAYRRLCMCTGSEPVVPPTVTTDVPLTCSGFDCSSHDNDLDADSDNVICTSDPCTDTECCTVLQPTVATPGWYLGEAGSNQSCVQVCTLHELGCEDGNWGVNDPQTLLDTLVAAGEDPGDFCADSNNNQRDNLVEPHYPYLFNANCRYPHTGAGTTCSAEISEGQRLCWCTEPSPVAPSSWHLGEVGENQSCDTVCLLHGLRCEPGDWEVNDAITLQAALAEADLSYDGCDANSIQGARSSNTQAPYAGQGFCRWRRGSGETDCDGTGTDTGSDADIRRLCKCVN